MKTITFQGDTLPDGKINLLQLQRELPEGCQVSYCGGGTIKREINKQILLVEVPQSLEIKYHDEVTDHDLGLVLKNHSPLLTDMEEATSRKSARVAEDLDVQQTLKAILRRLEALEGKK